MSSRPSRKAAIAANNRLNGDLAQSSGSDDEGSGDGASWASPRKPEKKPRRAAAGRKARPRRSVVGSDDEVGSEDEEEAGWDSDNVVSDEESALGSDEDEDEGEAAEFVAPDGDEDDEDADDSEESDGDGDGGGGGEGEGGGGGAKRPRSSGGQTGRKARAARLDRQEKRAAARDGPRARRGSRSAPAPGEEEEPLEKEPAPSPPEEPAEPGWKAKGHSLVGMRYCRALEGEAVAYGTIRKWRPALGSSATAGGGHLFRAVDDDGGQEDLDQEDADEAVEAYDQDAFEAHRSEMEGGGEAKPKPRGKRARAREEREEREAEEDGGEGALDLKEWRPQGGEREGQRALAFALGECERIGGTIADRLEAMGLVAKGGCLGSSSLGGGRGGGGGGGGGNGKEEAVEVEAVAAAAEGEDVLHVQQPASMAAVGEDGAQLALSEYQLVGLNWLLAMKRLQLGCILADDMGLGKTVQACVT